MLASIVFRAVLAGLIVGLIVTVAHQLWTVPLILQAEVYERSAETTGHEHEHDGDWAPADGFERTAYTAGADILTTIGFALLLCGAYVLSGRRVTWRAGALWGLAGFAVFSLAPGLGLPPELPGMPTAPLVPRQTWWIATAVMTAAGLGLIVLHRRPWSVALGVVLIVVPHLWGAPAPSTEASTVPDALWRSFVVAAMATSLLSWVLLGLLTGFLHARGERAPRVAGVDGVRSTGS